MTPHLGDVVLVFADPHYNNGADVAPAVVTRVWSDACVNVRALHDGPAIPPGPRMDWLTSVPLYARRELAEAAHQAAWERAGHEVPPFGAFWPPCEPEPVPPPANNPDLPAARL